MVSELFDADRWEPVTDDFDDITYHRGTDIGAVRIAFDRPGVRNAFRPETVDELHAALDHAKRQTDVGCVLLTGNGPSPRDGGWAFCAGGDQRIRGEAGYEYEASEAPPASADASGKQGDPRATTEADFEDTPESDQQSAPRLHILEVQRLVRHVPKPVVAVVPGWAVGGGHSLHVVCDMTLASAEHAKFLQTDPDVASFDGGFGSAYLARQVGHKKAREVFFLGKTYSAKEAVEMGMANEAVPHDELEEVALVWAEEICSKSPMAIRMLKYAFNMDSDGLVGQQVFAGEATRLGYMTEEAREGREAFTEGREPDFEDFEWYY
ncbi:1,4-dihydroxy-2-naphthoyl-CoA synthase [Halobacteriales archaeon QH_7_69_31]|nr:MAG: 1,4-dihydroxy-2-naphthoyl-CoA synthase [Halobacteriales archaeon QH_7_69_31]